MGLLARVMPRVERRDATSALWSQALATRGVALVGDPAGLSAVWACVRLLTGTIASLPLEAQRVGPDGRPAPADLGVLADPHPETTAPLWRGALVQSLLTCGNAWGLVAVGSDGRPTSVELLDPRRCGWVASDRRWAATLDGRQLQRWPLGPLWHAALFVEAGSPVGRSPLQIARRAVEAGALAEEWGLAFYRSGATPTGVISAQQPLAAEQAAEIKAAFARATAQREPVVLGAGLSYARIGITPEEAQWVEAQRFTVEQIARIFGVPPEMIGAAPHGSSVTYANREARSADFLAYGLLPYLVPLEAALAQLAPPGVRVRFRTAGLLRADLRTRYESYRIAADVASKLGRPLLTIEEMRDFEDLPPLR